MRCILKNLIPRTMLSSRLWCWYSAPLWSKYCITSVKCRVQSVGDRRHSLLKYLFGHAVVMIFCSKCANCENFPLVSATKFLLTCTINVGGVLQNRGWNEVEPVVYFYPFVAMKAREKKCKKEILIGPRIWNNVLHKAKNIWLYLWACFLFKSSAYLIFVPQTLYEP